MLPRAAMTAGLVLWAGAVQGQAMRPFATFRQLHGETRLGARLEYAAGMLRVAPGPPAQLYRMDLSFDPNRYEPMSAFDAATGSVVLGLRRTGDAGVRVVSRKQLNQAAAVTFSPQVDLALDLTLGAADASLELGGLRVTRFDLKTGASRTIVRFSRPNAARCERATISAGAAEVSVLGLGNSRCDEIEFEGGVGKVTLDFAGAWSTNLRLDAKLAVGELTLRLPRKAGVRITMGKFLASFKPAGLIPRADGFVSSNYERSPRRLDIDLTTAVGGVKVEWVD